MKLVTKSNYLTLAQYCCLNDSNYHEFCYIERSFSEKYVMINSCLYDASYLPRFMFHNHEYMRKMTNNFKFTNGKYQYHDIDLKLIRNETKVKQMLMVTRGVLKTLSMAKYTQLKQECEEMKKENHRLVEFIKSLNIDSSDNSSNSGNSSNTDESDDSTETTGSSESDESDESYETTETTESYNSSPDARSNDSCEY